MKDQVKKAFNHVYRHGPTKNEEVIKTFLAEEFNEMSV